MASTSTRIGGDHHHYSLKQSGISAETSVRIPTFSLDEFNNFVSSVLDKGDDLSLSFQQPTFSHSPSNSDQPAAASESSSSSSSDSATSPISSRGFFLKLKNSASELVHRNRSESPSRNGVIGGTTVAGNQPIDKTQGTSSPPPSPVKKHILSRSRSISFLSFSHSHSSSSTSISIPPPISDIKRSLSKQLKHTPSLRSLRSINTIRSRSSLKSFRTSLSLSLSLSPTQAISRPTISNPSPGLPSSPDSNPVRDCSDFAYGLAFEYPRRAPLPPPPQSPSQNQNQSRSPSGPPSYKGDGESEMEEHAPFNLDYPDLGIGLGLLRADADAEAFDRLVQGGGGGLRDSGLGFLDGVNIGDLKVPEQGDDRRLNSKPVFESTSKADVKAEAAGPTTTPFTATSTPKRGTRAYPPKAGLPRLCTLTVPPFSTCITPTTTTPTTPTTPKTVEYLHPNSAAASTSVPSSPSASPSTSTSASTPTPTASASAAASAAARPSELDYTPTPTPTPTQTRIPIPTISTYTTHPYAHICNQPLPSPSPSPSTSTPSQLPTPLSTMFFPLPPPASPSLLEAIGGMARAATVGVSARISVGFGGGGGCGKDRDKGKEASGAKEAAGWKKKKQNVPVPLPSLKKKESRASFKLGALLSRLSPTSSVFSKSSTTPTTASTSRIHLPHPQQPQYPDPLLSPVLHITAPATSPVDSCVSLVYTSDGEDEEEDGVGSPLAPLTPLEPAFGQSASTVRIGVAGEQQEHDQSRSQSLLDDAGSGTGGGYTAMSEVVSKDKEREREREKETNRLLRVRTLSLSRSSTRSQPSLLGVLDSLDYPTRGGNVNGLTSSPTSSLSPLHARRRRRVSQVQAYPPPFLPLPTSPPSCHHLSPTSTPSRSPQSSSPSQSPSPTTTADWTLALPLADRHGPLSLKRERAKDAEYKRRREEQRRRDDWTLGLDLAWSAGLLMGDKKGTVGGGSSTTRSRSFRQQKEAVESLKIRATSRITRPSLPFPLLDGNRSRRVSLAVVDEDEDVDVRAQGGNGSGNVGGEMERALQTLLSDAGESLRVEDKTMTSSSREPWSSSSSSASTPSHSDSGIEWSLRPISPMPMPASNLSPEAEVDRASIISGPYYSARSSWQSALRTMQTSPRVSVISSHLDFSCIPVVPVSSS